MIDLSGITPISDVTVKLHDCSISLDFLQPPSKKIVEDLESLEAQGIRVCGGASSIIGFTLFPGNYDKVQIAERVACHLESYGLKVSRLVPPATGDDRSATVPVPSFVLA